MRSGAVSAQDEPDSPAPVLGSASASLVADSDLVDETNRAIGKKDYARALRLLDELLIRHPQDGETLKNKLIIVLELGRTSDAVVTGRKLVAMNPQDQDNWSALCWALVLNAQPVEARSACESALRIEPNHLGSLITLGHTWLLTGDMLRAHLYYRKSLWLIRDEDSLHSGPLADFDIFIRKQWHVEETKQSIAWFRQEWAGWNRVNVLFAQFNKLTAQGQYQEALVPIRRAIQLATEILGESNSVVGALTDRMATALQNQGDYAQALSLFRKALGITEKADGLMHLNTASRLNNLGNLHRMLDQTDQALPLLQRALAISEYKNGADSPENLTYINNLSLAYQAMGQFKLALPLARRALAMGESRSAANDESVALLLNNLALVYSEMQLPAQSTPLFQRAVDLSVRTNGPDHPNTAMFMANLASNYQSNQQYSLALVWYRKTLSILEKSVGPDHPYLIAGLIGVSNALIGTGDHAQVAQLLQRASAIQEKSYGLLHPRTVTLLNVLSGLYIYMGHYENGLTLARKALSISERIDTPTQQLLIAQSLNNIAGIENSLGQDGSALEYYRRALEIVEKASGPEHPETGRMANNLANYYLQHKQYDLALPLFERALTISEKVNGPLHPKTGISLNNLAALYLNTGRYAKAKPLFERALTLSEKVEGPLHQHTGIRLQNLAGVYVASGNAAQAKALLLRAEQIASVSGNIEGLWRVREDLARLHAGQNEVAAAIFWAKQSINTIQSLRAGLIKLDRDMQTGFLKNKRDIYSDLSQWLIDAGRIPESQRVMALLKEEELFDFVRRDASASPAQSELPLTGVERQAHEEYYAVRERLAPLAQEALRLEELERKGGALPADLARLAELQAPLAAAREAFDAFTSSLAQRLQARQPDKVAGVQNLSTHQTLLNDLGEAGQRVAAVQYIVGEERLSIIVSTQAIQLAREVRVSAKELSQQVAALRTLLQDPRRDPRPAAQALHALLIRPILPDLQGQQIDTLMLVLDGVLRYLPMAALHDGQQYLVERYALALYTEAARTGLVRTPAAQWRGAALGVSRGFPEQQFQPLPAVPGELGGIVHPEVLPGTIYLDEQFTLAALRLNLSQPVLHIASHFRFIDGSDESYLLLGDGSRLTLRDVRLQLPALRGVDLLTLSACDTATGGGLREDGREVEGLGVEAQRKGARAVLASLWPVADQSTGLLMQQFYRIRQQSQAGQQALNKASALRKAQLALLGSTGAVGSAGQPSAGAPASDAADARGAKPVASEGGRTGTQGDAPPAFQAPPGQPYAHPYYWAPFILMGNWL